MMWSPASLFWYAPNNAIYLLHNVQRIPVHVLCNCCKSYNDNDAPPSRRTVAQQIHTHNTQNGCLCFLELLAHHKYL